MPEDNDDPVMNFFMYLIVILMLCLVTYFCIRAIFLIVENGEHLAIFFLFVAICCLLTCLNIFRLLPSYFSSFSSDEFYSERKTKFGVAAAIISLALVTFTITFNETTVLLNTVGNLEKIAQTIKTGFTVEEREAAARILGKGGDDNLGLLMEVADRSSGEHIEALAGLALIEDPAILPAFQSYMDRASDGYNFDEVLGKYKYTPENNWEKVHYLIFRKDHVYIRRNWQLVRSILLDDISKGQHLSANKAVSIFLGIGRSELIEDLEVVLTKHGTKALAEVYANSGSADLYKIANNWCRRNGCKFTSTLPYKEGTTRWGSF